MTRKKQAKNRSEVLATVEQTEGRTWEMSVDKIAGWQVNGANFNRAGQRFEQDTSMPSPHKTHTDMQRIDLMKARCARCRNTIALLCIGDGHPHSTIDEITRYAYWLRFREVIICTCTGSLPDPAEVRRQLLAYKETVHGKKLFARLDGSSAKNVHSFHVQRPGSLLVTPL